MLSHSALREELSTRLDPPDPIWESGHGLTNAAVIAPILLREDGGASLVFTLRRPELKHHGGEVSFPGGRAEAGETPATCALREFEEETGLAAAEVELMGALDPRTSIARFRVRPFVGLVRGGADVAFEPEAGEVAEILIEDLAELKDRSRWSMRDVRSERGKRYSVPFYDLGGHTLWGLTARFTLDLLERLPGLIHRPGT